MCFKQLLPVWALVMVFWAADTLAQTVSIVVGNEAHAECQIALELATATFQSTRPTLIQPLVDLNEQRVSVVSVGRSTISGGGEDREQSDVFEVIDTDYQAVSPILHWQRDARNGRRIVLLVSPFGWRGHWHYLFVVDEELSQNDFIRNYHMAGVAGLEGTEAGHLVHGPILDDNRWLPPVILEDAESGRLWVIDTSPIHAAMPPWRVFLVGDSIMISPCQIDFVSEGTVGLDSLPPEVQRFAALADEALGPGNNEGTLQSTARIRAGVARAWATVSERPWALTAAVYNSRDEVDNALETWATGVPSRQRLLSELREFYKAAGQALADFYSAEFDIANDEARIFSAFAIDYMLRRHFVSPRQGRVEQAPADAPWPEHIR